MLGGGLCFRAPAAGSEGVPIACEPARSGVPRLPTSTDRRRDSTTARRERMDASLFSYG